MEITLKRKASSADKDPLLIILDSSMSLSSEKRKKEIIKIAIGETVDLPDEVAYHIMAKYKGFFEINLHQEKSYKNKSMKTETPIL